MTHFPSASPPRKAKGEHLLRWLTASLIIPPLFLLICYGSQFLFASFIVLVALAAAYEYGAITLGENAFLERALLLGITPLTIAMFHLGNFLGIVAIVVLTMLMAFCISIRNFGFAKNPVVDNPVNNSANNSVNFDTSRPMTLVFGLVYIPLALAHIVGLRTEGIIWVFFALVFPMIGDTAAFYIGKNWGRRKLAPLLSPHKTVEGFIAIPISALLGGGVFAYFLLPEVSFYHIAIITVVGSILGQIGDLCESLLKRARGLKDSSSILPGHGGVLDRIDSLLFVFPFVYYYKVFLLG